MEPGSGGIQLGKKLSMVGDCIKSFDIKLIIFLVRISRHRCSSVLMVLSCSGETLKSWLVFWIKVNYD